MDITVWVKPGSRKGPLIVADEEVEHRYTVFVRERSVDGKANAALVDMLAEHFGVPKTRVSIRHGFTSRLKHIRIEDPRHTE